MTSKKPKQIVHAAPGGYRIYLKKLPTGVFLDAAAQDDKPSAPLKEVIYAGGTAVMELDYQNPKYIEDMNTWQAMYNARMFKVCLVYGIDHVEKQGKEAGPSADEVAEIRMIYPRATPREVFLHWCAKIIDEGTGGFINLVLGQTEPLEEEIAAEQDNFRPETDGTGDPGEEDN